MLYKLLDQNFSIAELKILAAELGLVWENIPGEIKILKANELADAMDRNNRNRELLAALDRSGKSLDLNPYLYLVILDFFDTEAKMEGLLATFGFPARHFGGTEKFPWGSKPWLEQKAKALQTRMEDEGRIKELLAAIQAESQARFKINVDFTFYVVPGPGTADADDEEVDPAELEEADVYQNFDLDLRLVGDNFLIEAAGSEGEASTEHKAVVLKDPALHELLAFVSGLVAGPEDARQLGNSLRDILFAGNIWTKYKECLKASEGSAGLRLRLRLRDVESELLRFPWEYCRDDQDYFAVNTPVVRYLKTDKAPKPITVPGQVRLLIATASPAGYDSLSVTEEAAAIEAALGGLTANGKPLIKVKVKHGVTINDLDDEITSQAGFRPHILHFIGHGQLEDGKGWLVLDNGKGQAQLVDGEMLLRPLRNSKSKVKVVILNACLTAAFGSDQAIAGLAPRLVWGGIPAVVAMQYAIPDSVAVEFAVKLYGELAAGAPLDEAITDARRRASFDGNAFWAIPALYMRSPDGVIWKKGS